jgi:PKD repeat protein
MPAFYLSQAYSSCGNRGVRDDRINLVCAMKKQNTIHLVVFGVLVLAAVVVPVSGGLTIVEEGAIITTTTGPTSPVIQITGSPIPAGNALEIDVSTIRECFSSHSLGDPNIEVHSTAASPVVWTPLITNSGNTMTLTSAGGPTAVGENITVTFKGTAGNPWIANSGDIVFTVPVTRTDTGESAEFIFEINTIQSGLTITDGVAITTTTGATSPVITIIDSPIAAGGTITIDVTNLRVLFASTAITNANVEIHSTAASPVIWTPSITHYGHILTLTSSGGPSVVGNTINMTFKGTAGNPWKEGNDSLQVTVIRDDTHNTAVFTIQKNIPLPGSLTVADGATITTTTGATSPVITITNEPIARNGTITINTTKLNAYVVGGNLTTANVVLTDTAAAANWTGSVAGNILTLTSTGGATAKEETVTVIFTGAAGAAWVNNTGAKRTIPLIVTRGDTLKTGSFTFVIDIGGRPVADFSASSLSAMAPATITFIDKSSRSSLKWNWSFGDGAYSELQNPSHYYTTGGLYTVSLNATNARGSNTIEKSDYLDIYNGAVRQANTLINGLTITNCGNPQFITVDTTVLPAALTSGNSVLEIQPPADSGFKNITIYATNGVGFSRTGNLISGSPTYVHLVSEDIPPPSVFSDYVGSKSSVTYSIDLPTYPCNAILSTNIREGVTPENTAKLHKIASGQTPQAVPKGTAYTASSISLHRHR